MRKETKWAQATSKWVRAHSSFESEPDALLTELEENEADKLLNEEPEELLNEEPAELLSDSEELFSEHIEQVNVPEQFCEAMVNTTKLLSEHFEQVNVPKQFYEATVSTTQGQRSESAGGEKVSILETQFSAGDINLVGNDTAENFLVANGVPDEVAIRRVVMRNAKPSERTTNNSGLLARHLHWEEGHHAVEHALEPVEPHGSASAWAVRAAAEGEIDWAECADPDLAMRGQVHERYEHYDEHYGDIEFGSQAVLDPPKAEFLEDEPRTSPELLAENLDSEIAKDRRCEKGYLGWFSLVPLAIVLVLERPFLSVEILTSRGVSQVNVGVALPGKNLMTFEIFLGKWSAPDQPKDDGTKNAFPSKSPSWASDASRGAALSLKETPVFTDHGAFHRRGSNLVVDGGSDSTLTYCPHSLPTCCPIDGRFHSLSMSQD